MNPMVEDNLTEFKWSVPNLEGIRSFAYQILGWYEQKVDDLLIPLTKQLHQNLQVYSFIYYK